MSDAKKIAIITDYLIAEGTHKTHSGNYILTHVDVVNQFPGLSLQWIQQHHRDIRAAIDSREEVISETWDEMRACEVVGWDMIFGLAFCPNIEEAS